MKNEVLRIEHHVIPLLESTHYPDIYLNVFASENVGLFFDNIQDSNLFISIFQTGYMPPEYLIEICGVKADAQNFQSLVFSNISLIGTYSQLLGNLSIAENIFLFEKRNKDIFAHEKAYQKMLEELFSVFNIDIPINRPTASLSFFDTIRIDMLRAFIQKKKILVLSGIVNLLSEAESSQIYHLISLLRQRGISFLTVGSNGQEVFSYAERYITVMHRKTVAQYDMVPLTSDFSNNNVTQKKLSNSVCATVSPVLSFSNVQTDVLAAFSFDLYPGEIMVVYADEASLLDFVSLLKEKKRCGSGSITFNKSRIKNNSLFQLLECRFIAYIEENPIHTMLIPSMTLLDNLCLSISLKFKSPHFSYNRKMSVINQLSDIIDKKYFNMRISDVPLTEQYKAVYCKWLLFNPKIVVCIRPFASIDDKIQNETNKMINLLADKGCAVLIIVPNSRQMPSNGSKVIHLQHKK